MQALKDWGARINHMHLKDARLAVVEGIIREGAPVEEIWRRAAFCPLGEGDVDIDGVLAELRRLGYSGWIVVEQDRIPSPQVSMDEVRREQAANREFLRARGL